MVQNSDPPLAVGPGSSSGSYTVYAILFCGSSLSQYLAELTYDAAAKQLTYLKRTAVSPVTYGPQHMPKTVRSRAVWFTINLCHVPDGKQLYLLGCFIKQCLLDSRRHRHGWGLHSAPDRVSQAIHMQAMLLQKKCSRCCKCEGRSQAVTLVAVLAKYEGVMVGRNVWLRIPCIRLRRRSASCSLWMAPSTQMASAPAFTCGR